MDVPTCLFCGKCLNVCPVFQLTLREEWSPRSKAFCLNILKEREASLELKELSHVIGICLGCGRCERECPQHISVPSLVMEVKEACPSFKKWAFGKFVSSMPWVFGRFGFLKNVASSLYGENIKALAIYCDEEPPEFFRLSPHRKDMEKDKKKATVFAGCGGEFLRPVWNQKMKDIGALFYEMEDLSFNCCGYPLLFSGLKEKAREYMRRNIEIWKEKNCPHIIVGCATCEMALRKYYPSFFDIEEEKQRWENSIVSLNELLGRCFIKKERETSSFIFHSPCHLSSSIFQKVIDVFQRDLGTFKVEDSCCGFGGSMRLENPILCDMLGSSIWERIGRDKMVIGLCTGCIIQFKFTSPSSSVFHWIDLVKI